MRKIFIFAIPVLFILLTLALASYQQKSGWANVIAQLLDHPAPPPPMLKEAADAIAENYKLAMKRIANPDQEPGEGASPKEVVSYWELQERRETGKQLSEKAGWQLLETCLRPDSPVCWRVMDFFPDTSVAHNRVKQFLETPEPQSTEATEITSYLTASDRKETRDRFRGWLMRHSNFFRDELLQKAREVSSTGYQFRNSSSLEALARMDWNAAKPIIENYANQPESAVQTYALKLLYLRAVQIGDNSQAETIRRRMMVMVANPQVAEDARREAYDTLTAREWPGRDEWFSTLLTQSNLIGRNKPLFYNDTIANPIKDTPEKWNPLLSQLVASGNQTVHNNAALILATVALRKPNREALLPLLPWLIDPKWVTTGEDFNRRCVVEAAGKLQLPEAVSGLLWIIQNEKDSFTKSHAATALACYSNRQIVAQIIPVLRAAIRQEPVDSSLSEIIRFLVINNGLDDVEVISAVESLAVEAEARVEAEFILNDREKDWTPHFLEGEKLSRSGWIGHALMWQHKYGQPDSTGARRSPFTESIVAGLIARAKALQGEKPDVAAKLWMIARALDFPVVYIELAKRVVEADADLETTLIALKRRQKLVATGGTALQPMLRQSGYPAGIAAILLNDEDKTRSILEGKDSQAQTALLACARVSRVGLPVDLVGQLLTATDKQLALAAERYLESEDSPVARQLILARHSNEALILGGSPDFHPKRKYWEDWTKWEDALREDVKQGQAEEVFGEYEVHYSDAGGPDRFSLEIHVRGQQATICRSKDPLRKECRALLEDELSALRSLFDEIGFDQLQPLPLPGGGYGGTAQEFVWLNKAGGRRVYATNLSYFHSDYGLEKKSLTPHDRISAFFDKLKKTGEYELRYALKEKIKALEVVSADDKRPVSQVCGDGGHVRALVKDEAAKYSDLPKWRAVTGVKVGDETDQPSFCQANDTREDIPESIRLRYEYSLPLWRVKTKDGIVRNMTWNEQRGLWLCQSGAEPKLITKEAPDPVTVTPDGRWLIASTRNRDEDTLLRIDLKTGQSVKVEAAGWVSPIVVEPLTGRIVIPTFSGSGDKRVYEVKLYTPSTGKIESAPGEFEPLKHQHSRALQPIAGSATEFWAAIPDEEKKKTKVGRYDARAFKFTLLMELPEITFNSTNIWVDETANWLYFIYNGHLLRVPFPIKK